MTQRFAINPVEALQAILEALDENLPPNPNGEGALLDTMPFLDEAVAKARDALGESDCSNTAERIKSTRVPKDSTYPAFPFIAKYGDESMEVAPGMTMRQWFVGQVLAGMDHAGNESEIAKYACDVADAALARTRIESQAQDPENTREAWVLEWPENDGGHSGEFLKFDKEKHCPTRERTDSPFDALNLLTAMDAANLAAYVNDATPVGTVFHVRRIDWINEGKR